MPGWPTNYAGYFDFDDDGDSATFQPYSTWQLSIDAPLDADHDGIPDFSDDPALVVIQKPQLALRAGNTNLLLTISGETGHMYQLQATTTLNPTSWQAVQSISLTNNSQSVSLALPPGPTFWRVRVE